jgi:hypothetical protein
MVVLSQNGSKQGGSLLFGSKKAKDQAPVCGGSLLFSRKLKESKDTVPAEAGFTPKAGFSFNEANALGQTSKGIDDAEQRRRSSRRARANVDDDIGLGSFGAIIPPPAKVVPIADSKESEPAVPPIDEDLMTGDPESEKDFEPGQIRLPRAAVAAADAKFNSLGEAAQASVDSSDHGKIASDMDETPGESLGVVPLSDAMALDHSSAVPLADRTMDVDSNSCVEPSAHITTSVKGDRSAAQGECLTSSSSRAPASAMIPEPNLPKLLRSRAA